MTYSEIIFLLLDNVFFSNFIQPFKNEYVLNIIIAFEAMNIFLAQGLSVLAAMAAIILNYFVGKGIFALAKKTPALRPSEARLNKMKNFFGNKFIFLVFFSWVDIAGTLLTIFYGYLNVNFRLFLLFTFLGRIFYYFILKNI